VFPANALGSIATEQDVPLISQLLDAEDDDEIRAGAYALGLIGRPAAMATPKLKTLLPSVSDKTQRTVRWALSRM
jgi:HEAT repeat protein